MKTHKVRPILIPTKDIHSQLEIDDMSIGKLSYEAKQYHCKHPQERFYMENKATLLLEIIIMYNTYTNQI